MAKEKTVRINKKDIPIKDILQIRTVYVSDTLFKEIKYRLFEPSYHEVTELIDNNKGYKVELTVRRAKHN